jgi:hypothetical protein
MSTTIAPHPQAIGEAADPGTPAERLWELARHPSLTPVVAANPAAPAELLRELGSHLAEALPLPAATAIALMTHGRPGVATEHLHQLGLRADDPTLSAVVANPNTPVDTLIRLAGVFPEQFCTNPVFPLLLLESPNLPGEMPLATTRSLLRYGGVPRMYLEWLVNYGLPDVDEAARLHVNFSGDAGEDWETLARAELWKLPISESVDLLLELLGLGAVPEWLLAPLAATGDKSVRLGVARSPIDTRAALRPFRHAGAGSDLAGYQPPMPALDPAILTWLAAGGPYARRIAARNPHTPQPALELLAADPDRGVRLGAARNPSTAPHAFERLAADPAPDVRQLVARNPGTPTHILQRLAAGPSKDVRWTIARNPHTPLETLGRLARDRHRVVRQGVARNMGTPPQLLELLASDQHRAVRLAVARNPLTPLQALLHLSDDEDAAVRAAVARHPAVPDDLRAHVRATAIEASRVRDRSQPEAYAATAAPALAEQPVLDADALARAAAVPDPNARAAVAARPDAPIDLLRALADDDSPFVRAAVARNPRTPLDRLEWLADDEFWPIHRAVAENPSTPTELLERFAADYSWSNMRVRLAVVGNPNVSVATLEHLAGDLSVDVRRAVMHHPQTPIHARSRILASSLEMCSRSSESFAHVLALSNPAAPADYLAARAGSPEWLERYAITRNPAAPRHTLEALANDGNRLVRASARVALATHEQERL